MIRVISWEIGLKKQHRFRRILDGIVRVFRKHQTLSSRAGNAFLILAVVHAKRSKSRNITSSRSATNVHLRSTGIRRTRIIRAETRERE